MSNKKGKVYLVGAGPGDIGLITVKGMNCLKKADVVVYDFHLNAQVLSYVDHEAEFIYAGKRGGNHTMTQDEINKVIVEKALAGFNVCRLKGGDPFVFGRGGEEAQELRAAGVEFEVVPGISSSIAAPAYAGIPLTHRNFSSTFAVIPGYEDITKKESTIDWSKLATGVGTLVFLMAVKNIEQLANRLMEHGRKADTPVAVIRWGTRAEQQTTVTTLADVARVVKEKDIKPPAVTVVGDVVSLREELNWYEPQPMFGVRILVTREEPRGFEHLEEMGAELFAYPTIKVVKPESYDTLDASIKGIVDGSKIPDWVVLTSANGVKYFFDRFMELGYDMRDMKGIKFCAVGSKTAAKINERGIRVDLVPAKFNAEGLVKSMAELSGGDLKGVTFLLPRAEVARQVFPEKIREMGGTIDVPIAYRAVKPTRRPRRLYRFLSQGQITVATFTSAATFENFMELVDNAAEHLKGVAIAAMGPVTAKAIEKAGLKVDIMPEESTMEAFSSSIEEWISKRG